MFKFLKEGEHFFSLFSNTSTAALGHSQSLNSMGMAFCLELKCPAHEFYDLFLYNAQVLKQ